MSGEFQGAEKEVSRVGSFRIGVHSLNVISDADKAMERYDEWMNLRQQAIENHKASGSTAPLPKHLADDPPPRPEPYVDEGFADVTVDLTANGFDPSESFNIENGKEESVPLADPGMEQRSVSRVGGTRDRGEFDWWIQTHVTAHWTCHPCRIGDS